MKRVIVTFVAALSMLYGTSALATKEVRVIYYKSQLASILVHVMQQERLLEQQAQADGLGEVKLTTKLLTTAVSGNEAIVADQLDLVFAGVQTFLKVNSVNPGQFQLLDGWMHSDIWLVCHDTKIRRLSDIKDQKIAVTHATLAPHLVSARMMVAKEFGEKEWNRLQPNVVAITPTSNQFKMIASKSPDVPCALPGMPFQNIMVDQGGAHVVANSRDYGVPGAISAVHASTAWLEKNPRLAKAFLRAKDRAREMFEANPRKYIESWIKADQVPDVDADTMLRQLKESRVTWLRNLEPVKLYADFMFRTQTITEPLDLNKASWKAK